MTEFLHIAPTSYLDIFCSRQKTHLLLAHLIESDYQYKRWYALNKEKNPDHIYIMDNGMFEMFKQGKPAYPSEKLIEMATSVNADYIVMSDYPGEHCDKTIQAAEYLAPQIKQAGFKTFFCPQGQIGEQQQLLKAFNWASESPLVDYIGVSILAVPLSYGHGIEHNNKLQRFLSRWHFMNKLHDRGILSKIVQNNKKLHFLGMVDGPNEIQLVEQYLGYIDTWDSSAAVWAGLNGITFDNSPTGLLDGKFEKHVDFSHNSADIKALNQASHNVGIIDNMLKPYQE